jgi:16S rRNA (guanine527-N7)-methyltransferase
MPPLPDSPTSERERAALAAGIAALGLTPDATQIDQLNRYVELLLTWNRVYNLSAIRSSEEVGAYHLLDSLVVAPVLHRLRLEQARLLDVGSGGGLPGVPLAITCPQLAVTVLDSVGKKCAFLTQVKLELRLVNLDVVHARVERWRAAPFAVIVSRAFASLRDFTGWTRHLLAADGLWLALKGPNYQPELAALPADIEVIEALPLTVPGLNAERYALLLRPRTNRA